MPTQVSVLSASTGVAAYYSTYAFGISELGFISLQVYNAVGQEVAILVNEKKNPGSYEVEFS